MPQTVTARALNRALLGRQLLLERSRLPPAGTWERRRADLYASAEEWLGPPPPGLTVESSQELLVRRYLAGFGPSTRAEIASWAGMGPSDVATVLERLDLRRFQAEDG